MISIKLLINADKICDYVPVLSAASNLIDIFQKCVVLPFMSPERIKGNHYFEHLKNKSYTRCVILAIFSTLAAIYYANNSSSSLSEVNNIPHSNPQPISTKVEETLTEGVTKTLSTLFEGSDLSLEKLPIYPTVSNNKAPQYKKMTDPIMKGSFPNGRKFIVIGAINKSSEKSLGEVITLCQAQCEGTLAYGTKLPGHSIWMQVTNPKSPLFFMWNFIGPGSPELSPSQVENFENLKNFITNGKGKDLNGMEWEIPIPKKRG